MTRILLVVAIGLSIIVMGKVIAKGLEKSERAECYKWQDQAKEFREFYLTKAEADQCEYWGIKVDAPIKKLDRMY